MRLRHTFAKTIRNDLFGIAASAALLGTLPTVANTYVNHNLDQAAVQNNAHTEKYRTELAELHAHISKVKKMRDYINSDEFDDLEEAAQLKYDTSYEAAKDQYRDMAQTLNFRLMTDPKINELTYKTFTDFRFLEKSGANIQIEYDLEANNADSLNECRVQYLNSPAGTQEQIARQIYKCADNNDENSVLMTVLGLLMAGFTIFAGGVISETKAVKEWEKLKPCKPTLD